jgi:regulator of replication initiation timing
MKRVQMGIGLVLAALISATGSANYATSDLEGFKACATIADNEKRLACYDEAAAVFDFEMAQSRLQEAAKLRAETERLKAQAASEKAEADRLRLAAEKEATRLRAEAEREKAEKEAVIEAERQRQADLQALALEEFGQPGATDGGFSEITSTVVATKKPTVGGLYIKLGNGHIWQNVDTTKPGRVSAGMTVRIQETDLGGLFMTVEETGKSFRVKRMN